MPMGPFGQMTQFANNPLLAMMAMQQNQPPQGATPPAAAAPAAKPKGIGGLDPMTLFMISGALSQGAMPGAGGLATAAPGIAQALQGNRDRRDEETRSASQQRALALMQAGDMQGAIRVLGSAKGLEGDAFNMAGRLADRDYAEGREDKLYRRDRNDYVADRKDERSYDSDEWSRRYGVTRGDEVEDRDQDAALKRELARSSGRSDWEKVTAADGSVMWVIPGTNIQVDSGVDAPGAQTRSLLGAETTGRAVAGIPGAKEANARMATLEAGGYEPGKDMTARALDAVPFPGSDALAAKVGGEDFQSYKQAFAQFESAMMPIMSGAAVTESEAARLMNAVKPKLGDNAQTLQQKSAQRERMVGALDLALRGDREALNAMIEQDYGDAPGARADAPAGPAPRITNDADYDAVPPGGMYIAPDGTMRRKAA